MEDDKAACQHHRHLDSRADQNHRQASGKPHAAVQAAHPAGKGNRATRGTGEAPHHPRGKRCSRCPKSRHSPCRVGAIPSDSHVSPPKGIRTIPTYQANAFRFSFHNHPIAIYHLFTIHSPRVTIPPHVPHPHPRLVTPPLPCFTRKPCDSSLFASIVLSVLPFSIPPYVLCREISP